MFSQLALPQATTSGLAQLHAASTGGASMQMPLCGQLGSLDGRRLHLAMNNSGSGWTGQGTLGAYAMNVCSCSVMGNTIALRGFVAPSTLGSEFINWPLEILLDQRTGYMTITWVGASGSPTRLVAQYMAAGL